MIEVEKLTKDYGTVVAVRDVSFSVGKGEIVGFLGPNGAGKSTTLRIIAGFLGATTGRVRIDGIDVERDPLAARGRLGYMPEAAPLYPELRVREYLGFRARLKGVAGRDRKDAVARSMRQAAVTDMAETLIQHLSKGYRQRVALADALIARPPLLVLDEPTAGLDPNQIREVRTLVRELGEEHTILLSTHILSEVETTCTRAVVIDRGRLVAEGTLDELRAMRASRSAQIVTVDPEKSAADIAGGVRGVRVAKVGHADGLATLDLAFEEDVDPDATTEQVVQALVKSGLRVRHVARAKASLEDVFHQLTHVEPSP